MKLVLVAGPPSVGKTTIIKRIIEKMSHENICYFKIDVAKANEDEILRKEYNIKTNKAYSGDLCPDHTSVVIMKDVIEWAEQNDASLLIVESAGLCLRCSPYLTQGVGVGIVSCTSGIHAPEKMGPMLSLADVIITTRTDLVSQAEKEIMSQKLYELYKNTLILETNALQGYSLQKLNEVIKQSEEIDINKVELKGNPPVGTCTICIGKKNVGWKNHYGIVRQMSKNFTGFIYRGD